MWFGPPDHCQRKPPRHFQGASLGWLVHQAWGSGSRTTNVWAVPPPDMSQPTTTNSYLGICTITSRQSLSDTFQPGLLSVAIDASTVLRSKLNTAAPPTAMAATVHAHRATV